MDVAAQSSSLPVFRALAIVRLNYKPLFEGTNYMYKTMLSFHGQVEKRPPRIQHNPFVASLGLNCQHCRWLACADVMPER